MSHDVVFLLIGLLGAIPLSIGANLVSSRLDRRLEGRSVERAQANALAAEEDLERLRRFVRDPREYYAHLLEAVLRAALVGAIAGVVSGALFALVNVGDTYNSRAVLGGQLVAIFGSLVVIRIILPALRDSARVRNFSAYEEAVRRRIQAASVRRDAESGAA